MTLNEFTRLEIKETSQEGKEFLNIIRDSLCAICLKEFTAKNIREDNYLLSFAASCNKKKISRSSFYDLSLYVEHVNHKTCLPNKYQLEERERWIKSFY